MNLFWWCAIAVLHSAQHGVATVGRDTIGQGGGETQQDVCVCVSCCCCQGVCDAIGSD